MLLQAWEFSSAEVREHAWSGLCWLRILALDGPINIYEFCIASCFVVFVTCELRPLIVLIDRLAMIVISDTLSQEDLSLKSNLFICLCFGLID